MPVFYFDVGYPTAGEIHVEAVNDRKAKILDHNGPYECTIIPNDPLLPTETVTRDGNYGFNVASDVVDDWKQKHNLNLSTIWNLQT